MASAQILNSGKAMYAWDGNNWIPINAQNNIVNSTRWQKIAEGGETTLSGLDDNSNSLIYSPGFEQVFLNGILLVRNSDYTASNGTSITGLDPISEGSNIEIIALKQISLANVYNKAQSDEKFATAATVQTQLNQILDGAPAALDTLNELSAALNDDPNFYTTIDSVYQKIIPYSSSSPSNPNQGDLWVDSSTAPPALKTYDGSNWVQLGAAVDDSQAIIAGRMFA